MALWFIVPWLIPLGAWLIWSGWSQDVPIRIATGAVLLIVAVSFLGALYVASRRSDRRLRRKLMEGVVTEADLPLGGGPRRGSGRHAYRDDDISPGDHSDSDGGTFDIDAGGVD